MSTTGVTREQEENMHRPQRGPVLLRITLQGYLAYQKPFAEETRRFGGCELLIYSRNKANVSKTFLITFKKPGERFSMNREINNDS